jgi:hypothetical protein
MKKLITLTFALLFSAGIAFGQNTAVTSQKGDNNTATVNQGNGQNIVGIAQYGGNNNTANVSQKDGKNNALVGQNGDKNVAKVDQMYISGGSDTRNGAVVSQVGGSNTVLRLHQAGAGNAFGVTQHGFNNIVSIHPDQGDANGGAPSFDGNIQIHQTGLGNKVWDADQAGYGNQLTIIQDGGVEGGANIANVEAQVNLDEGTPANVINITQNGSDNVVGGYGTDKAGAYQEGSGNTMNITQTGGAHAGTQHYLPSGGPNSFTELYFRSQIEGGQGLIQLGKNNQITTNQTGQSFIPVLYQNGEGNVFNVTQTGNGNTYTGYQVGNNNTAKVIQQQ